MDTHERDPGGDALTAEDASAWPGWLAASSESSLRADLAMGAVHGLEARRSAWPGWIDELEPPSVGEPEVWAAETDAPSLRELIADGTPPPPTEEPTLDFVLGMPSQLGLLSSPIVAPVGFALGRLVTGRGAPLRTHPALDRAADRAVRAGQWLAPLTGTVLLGVATALIWLAPPRGRPSVVPPADVIAPPDVILPPTVVQPGLVEREPRPQSEPETSRADVTPARRARAPRRGRSATAGGAIPTGHEGPSRVEVAHAAARVAPSLDACVPGTEGRASVTFTLTGATGRVATVGLPPAYVGRPAGRCIERALARFHVRPFARDTFSVSYPFAL